MSDNLPTVDLPRCSYDQQVPAPLGRLVFDPAPTSRYLDRFGWLLLLTYATITAQSLVNVERAFTGLGQEAGNLAATVVSSAMLVLAMRASGVSRAWRRGIWVVIATALATHGYVLVARLVSNSRNSPPWPLSRSVQWCSPC